MRKESIIGWFCLLLAFIFDITTTTGRFLNGLAVGFFIVDIFIGLKKMRDNQDR
jgi:hypothetical protein